MHGGLGKYCLGKSFVLGTALGTRADSVAPEVDVPMQDGQPAANATPDAEKATPDISPNTVPGAKLPVAEPRPPPKATAIVAPPTNTEGSFKAIKDKLPLLQAGCGLVPPSCSCSPPADTEGRGSLDWQHTESGKSLVWRRPAGCAALPIASVGAVLCRSGLGPEQRVPVSALQRLHGIGLSVSGVHTQQPVPLCAARNWRHVVV